MLSVLSNYIIPVITRGNNRVILEEITNIEAEYLGKDATNLHWW